MSYTTNNPTNTNPGDLIRITRIDYNADGTIRSESGWTDTFGRYCSTDAAIVTATGYLAVGVTPIAQGRTLVTTWEAV